MARSLRRFLCAILLEMAALVAVAACVDAFSRLRFAFFLVTLLLQFFLTAGTFCDLRKFVGVEEVRRAQWDIRAKLCLLACAAWLPCAWWFFELVSELRGRRSYSEGRRHLLPVSRDHATAALGMFAYHALSATATTGVAWRSGAQLVPQLLKPKELRPKAFGRLPQRDREAQEACSICLEDFAAEDEVLQLPCRHVFHATCLGTWLQNAELCPLRCPGHLLQLPKDSRYLAPPPPEAEVDEADFLFAGEEGVGLPSARPLQVSLPHVLPSSHPHEVMLGRVSV